MARYEWPKSEEVEFVRAAVKTVARSRNPYRPAPFWARGPYPLETCVHFANDGFYELANLDKDDVPGPIIARSQDREEIAYILQRRWRGDLAKNIKSEAEWYAFLDSVHAYNFAV